MIDNSGKLHLLDELPANDKMFIQEILNDLHRQGINLNDGGNKAVQLLKDWSRELTTKAPVMRGRTKWFHALIVGKQNY
jgi:hypothetical protein